MFSNKITRNKIIPPHMPSLPILCHQPFLPALVVAQRPIRRQEGTADHLCVLTYHLVRCRPQKDVQVNESSNNSECESWCGLKNNIWGENIHSEHKYNKGTSRDIRKGQRTNEKLSPMALLLRRKTPCVLPSGSKDR